MLLISNGRMLDPASGMDAPRDILLDGDRIAAVAPHGELAERARGAEVFDARNSIVAPGFIDLHCHLREPGESLRKPSRQGRARPRVAASLPSVRCPIRGR